MSDPLSVSGSVSDLVSIGITLCQGLVQYYGSYMSCESDISTVLVSAIALSNSLTQLGNATRSPMFRADIVTILKSSATACQSGITALEKKLNKIETTPKPTGPWHRVKHHARKAMYPFKESTLAKLREIITDLRGNLTAAINVLQM